MNQTTRTILVTGASRGIGQAVCGHVLAAGWRVVGLARQFDELPDNPAFTPVNIDLSKYLRGWQPNGNGERFTGRRSKRVE